MSQIKGNNIALKSDIHRRDRINLIIFTLSWFILPVPIMLLMIGSLYKYKLFVRHKNYLFIIISLTFALLAFTQKSLSDTDISRYYGMYQSFESVYIPLSDLSQSFEDNLYYVFNPVSIKIVNITSNVQYFSLFWIFIVYYFYFLSLDGYLNYRGFKVTNQKWLLIIIISIFGFILFTQVTETIKQAVAMSILGYALVKMLNRKKCQSLIWIIIAFGIHSSVLLFLPLFLYSKISNKCILFLLLCSCILSTINIFELAARLVPAAGSLILLSQKINDYLDPASETASSLLRYDLIVSILLFQFFILKYFSEDKNKIVNILGLFVCVVLSTHFMSQNFTRFVNMGYFVYAIGFIECLYARFRFRIKNEMLYFICLAFFVANLHMTYYRTVGGSYRSSYFDNNFFQIVLSSCPSYLSFEY